jgi:hypothetical protein
MYAFPASVPQCAARFGSFDDFENSLSVGDRVEFLPHKPALRETGLMAGAMVANENGWAAVETIRPGDMVLTFDHGMQCVLETRSLQAQRPLRQGTKAFSMFVPKGAIGNRSDLQVMPMQEVIFESDTAETLYGDPFVLIPALMLDGYNGICKRPIEEGVCTTVLVFATEQIVHTNGGMLALAPRQITAQAEQQRRRDRRENYPRLSLAQLRMLTDWHKRPTASQPDASNALFGSQTLDEICQRLERQFC